MRADIPSAAGGRVGAGAAQPAPGLSVVDAAAMTAGIVIGIGIFKAPAMVAASTGSELAFLLFWAVGGAISIVGALCYAELASAHPSAGGEYHFLRRAYGRSVSFLFVWGRIVVVQTGAIAAVAFVLGDYLTELVSLGPYSPAIYGVLAVAWLSWINVRGQRQSRLVQHLFTGATLAAVAAIVIAALVSEPAPPAAPKPPAEVTGTAGLAMIFVLLTYGGWNEAAYLSAEIRDVRRNMVRLLVLGLGTVIAVYLLLNLAYLDVLGLEGMRGSQAVAADLMRATFGGAGAVVLALVVAVVSISTLNGTIFTGARASYAVGRDFAPLGFLGVWNRTTGAPVNALLLQGAIAAALVVLGSFARSGFQMMVEFTAPVFWLFFLLTGLSLFVLRWREPGRELPFRVPLYPLTPALFCATSAYMLYSSIAYTGAGALLGAALLAAGLPLLYLMRPSRAGMRMDAAD